MKIQDLRDQLDLRGISSKGKRWLNFSSERNHNTKLFFTGLKPQLVARLSKTLKTEESESVNAEDNQNEGNAETSETQAVSNSSNEINECASNDSIDIDLADIVIIDEYDSTKTDSKHDSGSKRVSIIFNYRDFSAFFTGLIQFFKKKISDFLSFRKKNLLI